MYNLPRLGHWTAAGQTQSAGTVIAVGIPPQHRKQGGSPIFYEHDSNYRFKPIHGLGLTHISLLSITSGSTAHTWYALRPKNYTWIAEAVTKNDTTIVMQDNPGLYATTYKYDLPPGISAPGMVADNTPAANDYCAFQLDNGLWHFSLISSLSSLTLTIATGTPNVDGSTAAVGRMLFFFGAGGDVDPATGVVDPRVQPIVSAQTILGNGSYPIISALHPGDPIMLVNANASNASTLEALSGFYAKD